MDVPRLAAEAAHLKALLEAEAPQSDLLRGLLESLKPLLDAASAGTIKEPVSSDAIPGSRPFMEGELTPWPEIEQSYVRFKYLVSGREHILDNP